MADAFIPNRIEVDYTNHRGERSTRVVTTVGMWFGETQWHTGEQWFVRAMTDKGPRDLALKDIHAWRALG